jgi:Glycosyl transferase 4-like domain
MVSPHFPPDATAAAHRVRLLAPHLAAHGWTPTVVTVDPRDYEGELDPGLAALVPADLDVVRCRALPAGRTRPFGLGDLGLRALPGLYRACARLLARRAYDALYVTVYPTYPALLGPLLRRFGVPFVLDYQDPWVGAWGATTGPAGRPDLKSRLSRALAGALEPLALRAADAVTAVSRGTFEAVWRRHPELERPSAELPIGFDPADLGALARAPAERLFDPADGRVHLCAVGTLLPLAREPLRALLAALAALRDRLPALYQRLQLHFIGTSNQADRAAPPLVLPEAHRAGVAEAVAEVPRRVPYLTALAAQASASGLVLLGSTEPHYTASRLFPALLARRPILAAYHRASSVVAMLRAAVRPPTARVITFDEASPPASHVEELAAALAALAERPEYRAEDVDPAPLEPFTAPALAGRLAAVLDAARARRRSAA